MDKLQSMMHSSKQYNLYTSDMSKFITYLLEEATEKKEFSKTIAFVAGSFRPPTKAHFWMVQ